MSVREQNEKKFHQWNELPSGGRHYWFDIQGRMGWKARYNKIADCAENTIRFYQEILDDRGVLREIHQKYPTDTGHRSVKETQE